MNIIPQSVLETLGIDGTSSVSPAAVISYADVQTHLKLDGSADQTVVEAMISAATKRLEAFLDRKLITQHWSIYFDCFPWNHNADWWEGVKDGAVSTLYDSKDPIELPFGPCQSISFIRAYDQTDGTTTMDASAYSVDTKGPVGRIALKNGYSWPTVTLRPLNGVHVRGIFGLTSVPEDFKQALKLTVANFYEKRGDTSDPSLPVGAQLILEPYRRWKLR